MFIPTKLSLPLLLSLLQHIIDIPLQYTFMESVHLKFEEKKLYFVLLMYICKIIC